MSAKRKHGKGKYAYQAQKAVKNTGQSVNLQSASTSAVEDSTLKTGAVGISTNVVQAKNAVAAMPASIGKVDLMYEMKRIGIFSAFILVLLVVLSIILK